MSAKSFPISTCKDERNFDRVSRSRAAVAARTVVADARSLVSYKTMPASTEPLLGDDELDRVAQCMSPASTRLRIL